MLEVPNRPFAAPPPLPVTPIEDGTEPILALKVGPPPPPPMSIPSGGTDKVAVASTVCGLTPFIPVVSQLIGLALGIWALLRIRRGQRAGRMISGRGWAAAGITGNGIVLLGWLSLFGAFATLKGSLNDATHKLHPLLKKPAEHRVRVP